MSKNPNNGSLNEKEIFVMNDVTDLAVMNQQIQPRSGISPYSPRCSGSWKPMKVVLAGLALALLVTLIFLFIPIRQDKEELNDHLSAMSKMVQATHDESETLRKETLILLHDLHLCKNKSHETVMLLLDKGAKITSLTEEKRQFQSTIESLENQLAAKDAELKKLLESSETKIFEKNAEVKLLKQERSKLQYDFQSCESNNHATTILLRNRTASMVSLNLEKMALTDKIDILENQLTQNAEKEIATIQQHLGNKKNTSARLQKCLNELLQEKNNNSVNLLACTDNKKTEKLLQEQAGQNEVLHLKIQSLEQQVENLKTVVLKTTAATPIAETTKAVVPKTTAATPIKEDLKTTTQVPPIDDLSTTEGLSTPASVTAVASVMEYFNSFGRLFSAGTSVLPSCYFLSLNVGLILGMKFLF